MSNWPVGQTETMCIQLATLINIKDTYSVGLSHSLTYTKSKFHTEVYISSSLGKWIREQQSEQHGVPFVPSSTLTLPLISANFHALEAKCSYARGNCLEEYSYLLKQALVSQEHSHLISKETLLSQVLRSSSSH